MRSDSPQQDTRATALDQCLDYIRFARAAELSRTGSYLEAEALLSPNGRIPASLRELDLLARIAAQQERFDDAARFWNAALQRDPDNVDYRVCLKQLSRIQAGIEPTGALRGLFLWCCVGLCAMVVLIGLVMSARQARQAQPTASDTPATASGASTVRPPAPTIPEASNSPSPVSAPPQVATDPPATAAAISKLQETLAQMQQALAEQMELLTARLTAIQGTNSLLLASAHSTQARLAALDQSVTDINKHQAAAQRAIDSARSELASLVAARASGMPAHTNVQSSAPNLGQFKPNISGVTVISNQTGCIIRFDPGLFDRDQHFKIGAKARLQSVAKALVQTQAKIKIAVVGVADDEPTTWPWSRTCTSGELGLQRAQCVMAYLRSLGILPSDKLFAISGLPSQRPYPAPDRNNRTVLLAISVE